MALGALYVNQPNPWAKTLQDVAGDIKDVIQDKFKSSDMEKLAKMNSNNPEEIAKIMPELKTTEAKEAAMKMILQQRQASQPVPIYDATGKPVGSAPSNAHFLPASSTTPRGITQYVSPDGKQTEQLAYGDPRVEQYTKAGWKPMQLLEFQQKRQDTLANQQENRASREQMHADSVAIQQQSLDLRKDAADEKKKSSTVGMVANPDPNLTGEAALQNYSPEVQNRAKAILEGRAPYPTGYAMARDPVTKAALNAALEVDPSYNASQHKIRESTRKSFTSGKDAQNVTSINTLVGHLNSLDEATKGLGNTWSQTYNKLGNWMSSETGNPKVTKFEMAAGAVESELASVFKGTGATDQEIKQWREKIKSSSSPEQLHTVVHEGVDLMASRLQALKGKYENGMGPYGDMQILNPKSRSILEKLVGKEAVNALEPEKQQAQPATPHEMKSGAQQVINGITYVKGADGQWHKQE